MFMPPQSIQECALDYQVLLMLFEQVMCQVRRNEKDSGILHNSKGLADFRGKRERSVKKNTTPFEKFEGSSWKEFTHFCGCK
jgi:hypothetical protein